MGGVVLQAIGKSKGRSEMLGKIMCGESSCKILARLKFLWENYKEEIAVANPGSNLNICLHFNAFVSLLPSRYSLTLTIFHVTK